MVAGIKKIDPSSIPFDQYSRQLAVKNIIDKVFRQKNSQKSFHILDVGGYKGKTTEFMENDRVEILDIFDVSEQNYIKGDATAVDKKDLSYDFVCSFDVLEHIPRAKREKFIKESHRLSKIGFFIAAPMNDKNGLVSLAEHEANEIFKTINHKDHEWLIEHIEYGIPTNREIENILKKNKLYFTSMKSNELTKWFSIQSAFFIKSTLSKSDNFLRGRYLSDFYELHKLIDKTYNDNFLSIEGQQTGLSYRTIYFVSRDEDYVKMVEEYIDKSTTAVSSDIGDKARMDIYTSIFKAIATTVSILQDEGNKFKDIDKENNVLKNTLEQNKFEIKQKDNYIKTMQHSRSWRLTKPLRLIGYVLRLISKRKIR